MPNDKYSEKSKKLNTILEGAAQRASAKSGFVERESKLNGVGFAQTLVLGCLEQADVSLNGLVQVSADLKIEISPSGLNQRIDWEAVELLREMLAETVQELKAEKPLDSELLKQFTGVYILDSTQVSLPDCLQDIFRGSGGVGTAASAKMYLSYEYLHGEISALEFADGRFPDQKCRQQVGLGVPDSLHLFDLGFFKQEHLAELDEAGAYFISRYQSQTALYEQPQDARSCEVAALVESLAGDCYEMEAYLGQKSRVPVRVLFQRLPPTAIQERRRKAKAKMRRDKKTPSKRYLQMLEWAIFITNVPASSLTFEQVLCLYRVRWQIELIFKLWKSEAHLEALGNWRPERVLCQLFARLIGLVLFHWLIAPFRFLSQAELSLTKAFHVLQRHLPTLLQAMATDCRWLMDWLSRFERDLLRFARKDSRKKSPSSFRSLAFLGA